MPPINFGPFKISCQKVGGSGTPTFRFNGGPGSVLVPINLNLMLRDVGNAFVGPVNWRVTAGALPANVVPFVCASITGLQQITVILNTPSPIDVTLQLEAEVYEWIATQPLNP